MSVLPKRLSYSDFIKTSTPFYVDDAFENWFDEFVKEKVKKVAKPKSVHLDSKVSENDVITFLREQEDGLKTILSILSLSSEKFKRIITLIRCLKNEFELEWTERRIVTEIRRNDDFAKFVARLLMGGKNDPLMKKHLPLFYRERLELKELYAKGGVDELKLKLKDSYIGTYAGKKGYLVEGLIKEFLSRMNKKYGIEYEQGASDLIDVTVDFAIPSLNDPYMIIMSSYQETTASGQSTKTRDMKKCYDVVCKKNREDSESRVFINFVDGAGWLARKKDLKRLIENCHYALNIKTLSLLEPIILHHVPKRYFKS